LDEKYPKSLKKSNLLALLSNKDPNKFERETEYLIEHKLIEKKEIDILLPITFISSIPFKFLLGYKITAYGIDALKKDGRDKKQTYAEKRKKVNQPTTFISASFDDSADQLIQWVRNRAENVGFNTIWLKEIYKARPTIDKIDQAISESDAIIQIITSIVFEKGGEMGWIGNELGMAYKSRPGKNIAVFVQKGYKISGIGKSVTDIFPLDLKKLPQHEKKAEEYLNDLKQKVISSNQNI